MSKTIPAASINPTPIGRLGLPPLREPTLEGDELVSDYLRRNGVSSVKGRVYGVARMAALLTLAVSE